jgi:hypothetical protein
MLFHDPSFSDDRSRHDRRGWNGTLIPKRRHFMKVLWRGFALQMRIVVGMCLLGLLASPAGQEDLREDQGLIDHALHRQQRSHECKQRCEAAPRVLPIEARGLARKYFDIYPLPYPYGKGVFSFSDHQWLFFQNAEDPCQNCP